MLPRNINKNPPAHSPFLGLVPVKVNGNVKIALVKVFPSLPTNQTRITYVRTYCVQLLSRTYVRILSERTVPL